MAKLQRYLQKIFANNSNQVGVFGTGVDKETSKNVETLQSADYENGWSSAIITNKNYPIWQERDGVDYGFSYQLAYLMQNGIPEWLSTETYYTDNYCRYGSDIYYSLKDNNTNHNPALDDGWWVIIDKKFLNKTQITNVVTEIPQDIKLELNSGTLTLKAGSKVYVPNGFEQDGVTPKFDEVTIENDIAIAYGTVINRLMLTYDAISNVRVLTQNIQCYSGTAAPSPASGSTRQTWYDTTNNIIKTRAGSGEWSPSISFPIAIVNCVASNTFTVGQVFNGFGYIGRTYFVLPNVKALFADGRNEDGTYKNTEITYTNVVTGTASVNASLKNITIHTTAIGDLPAQHILYGHKRNMPSTVDNSGRWLYYAIDENKWYVTNGSTIANWSHYRTIIIGANYGDGTYITDFNLNQMPVKLVDTNDADGQWVLKHVNVASGATIPTTTRKTYSLVNYLPADGFAYEVLLDGSVDTTTTSGSYIGLYIGSDIIDSPTCLCEVRTRTSSIMNGGGNAIIPVGGDRTIYVGYGSGYTGTYELDVRGYRRIGRNA